MYKYIEQNIKNIRSRISAAAKKAGRSESEITIVAISKIFPSAAIKAAVNFGLTDIGESRVQEAEEKIKELGKIARWNLVGHLQSNKAGKAVKLFDMIQSLDSLKLAETLNAAAETEGKTIDCLTEINSSGELSKFGIRPTEAERLLEEFAQFRFLRLRGLMTVGPLTENEPILRASFRMTRKIMEQGQTIIGKDYNILSMGMSGDFEIAIEEGSTMVRLGTAIFGERKK